ncbi:SDR family oxidoreductase, partial [Mycobacterium tuberculosis]|nr:SDR family oxidoreductase [Mycobacterium tuberculosis]
MLVTGASRGIGLAAGRAFLAQGAKVGFAARSTPAEFDVDAAGPDAAFFAADVAATASCTALIDAFVDHFGGIDILINNAGGLVGRRPLGELDDDFVADVFNLNCRSAVMLTQAALPHLKAAAAASGEPSSVILVGSIAGHLGGGPGASLYGAAKAWLHNVQKNWVTYHTKDGIRFNTVAPGTFDTAFHADKDDAAKARIAAGIPMGRLGHPDECNGSFLYLASNALSRYVTGQVI